MAQDAATSLLGVPPPDGRAPEPRRVDYRKEYVGGGLRYTWGPDGRSALPHLVDDLTLEFGPGVYDAMLADPDVFAAYTMLKQGVLADGIQLASVATPEPDVDRVDLDGNPLPSPAKPPGPEVDPELAEEILHLCRDSMASTGRPFEDACYELLDGLAYGSKLAELVFDEETKGPRRGKWRLADLVPKPAWSWSFVVDARMKVRGYLCAVPELDGVSAFGSPVAGDVPGLWPGGFPVTAGAFGMGAATAPNPAAWLGVAGAMFLEAEKFAVFTWASKDGDPRGRSVLRPAWTAFDYKQRILPEYLLYASRFASPSLWGEAAPGELPSPDPDGGPDITPPQALFRTLERFQNGSVAAVSHGAAIHALEAQGEGGPFLSFLDWCSFQVAKAILLAPRATLESRHGGSGNAGVAKDIGSDTSIRVIKRLFGEALRDQVFRRLVAVNYGPDVARAYTPQVMLGGLPAEDRASTIHAVADLFRAGCPFTRSQMVWLANLIGMPAPLPSEDITPLVGAHVAGLPQAGPVGGTALKPQTADAQANVARATSPAVAATNGRLRGDPAPPASS